MSRDFPDWVLKHKKKGVAIEKRGDSFYASRVTSVWDPEKKRARKKTLEYLGIVTPNGIVPPKGKRDRQLGGVLEAGNFVYLEHFARHLSGPLRDCFPDDWESILAAAAIRLCYRESFGRMRVRYETCFAKRLWPDASLSKNSLSELLTRLGRQWPAQRDFFGQMAAGERHMAIDLSHIFSDSQQIPWVEFGHNGDDVWKPQVAIMLMWGTSTHRPGFLKVLPGAVHSAQTLVNAIKESNLKDCIAVLDKGFWSLDNMRELEEGHVHYAMALRRDLPMVKHASQSKYKEYFRYRKRAQWWRSTEWEGRVIYHFLDKSIADQEESTYLELIEEKKATMAEYKQLRDRFGTLSIVTDTGLSAEKTYALYKERRDVEYALDTLQNTLGGENTWMRSRDSMQGFLFIMFIALHLYSQVLDHLKRKDLLKRYSVHDVLTYLSKVCVVELDGKDHLAEVTKQTKKVIDLLEVPITKKLGL
jgi:transposase